jgi:hypothetical protein
MGGWRRPCVVCAGPGDRPWHRTFRFWECFRYQPVILYFSVKGWADSRPLDRPS